METEKKEKIFNGNIYEIVAWANDQEVVYYGEFGHWHGEWVLISRDKENYYIYKDIYGSCHICDPFEKYFGSDENITKEKAKSFVEEYEYKPFLVIPREKMINFVKNKTFIEIFPRNIRSYEINEKVLEEIANNAIAKIGLLENLEINQKSNDNAKNNQT